jgi:hypothetical protein
MPAALEPTARKAVEGLGVGDGGGAEGLASVEHGAQQGAFGVRVVGGAEHGASVV